MRPPNLSISPAGATGNVCAMQARLAERCVRLLLVLGMTCGVRVPGQLISRGDLLAAA